MYDSYVITSSCREVVRQFQANYQGVRVPSREVVRLLVNKCRETGSILDKKRNVKRRVLTEQKLEEIGGRLENSNQKSLRRRRTAFPTSPVIRPTFVFYSKNFILKNC